MVLIPYPPPTGPAPTPITTTIPIEQTLKRIWDPSRYEATALGFREKGPFSRFDHQRPDRPGSPFEPDAGRGIWYAGLTLASALIETFGSHDPSRTVDLAGPYRVGLVHLERNFVMLDLRGDGAALAGTVHALCGTSDRPLSQAWARYFYEETTVYGVIDGILYPSAHNGQECVAVFERAATALACPNEDVLPLAHPRLRPAIEGAARRGRLRLING
ncbi:MAG: hypothetical protein JWO59_3271 [Chloroflexi bacterium]|nr:hypothetical protein [Chloroflexota bacterium]